MVIPLPQVFYFYRIIKKKQGSRAPLSIPRPLRKTGEGGHLSVLRHDFHGNIYGFEDTISPVYYKILNSLKASATCETLRINVNLYGNNEIRSFGNVCKEEIKKEKEEKYVRA